MTLNINFAKNKGWNTVTPTPSFTTIGTVGSAGQMAAGHVLTLTSFPSAAQSITAFYNLTNVSDGNPTTNKTLINNGTALFTGSGILGVSNSCLTLNGTTQYLSSSDSFFDPGDTDFTTGGWFNLNSWSTGTQTLISQWNSSSGQSFAVNISGTSILVYYSTTGIDTLLGPSYNYTGLTSWHHVAIKYVASTNTLYLYLDGKIVSSFICSSNLYTVGTNRRFNFGTYSNGMGQFVNGYMDELFFCNGMAFTDNDISKIYARKYSHNLNITPLSQHWVIQAQSAGGQIRELFDNIVDMQANDLYYDLSDESSTTQVSLRLANIY